MTPRNTWAPVLVVVIGEVDHSTDVFGGSVGLSVGLAVVGDGAGVTTITGSGLQLVAKARTKTAKAPRITEAAYDALDSVWRRLRIVMALVASHQGSARSRTRTHR